MKIRNAIPHSFGDNILKISIPANWRQLSQKQLRYVWFALSAFPAHQAKTYMLMRFMGMKVLREEEKGWLCRTRTSFLRKRIKFHLPTELIVYFLRFISFTDRIGDYPVCLEKIGRFRKYYAVDPCFHGIPFSVYLKAENFYQGYLYTKDGKYILSMARLMYETKKGKKASGIKIDQTEELSVLMWFAALKNLFAMKFPDFLIQGDPLEREENNMPSVEGSMNAQIRALTGGDVTKEEEVLRMDTWRALTELNEKAREAKEMEERYGRK